MVYANRLFILIKVLVSGGEVAKEFKGLIPLTSDLLQQVHAVVRAEEVK